MNLRDISGNTALDFGMFNSLVISINLYNIYYLARYKGYNELASILIAAGGVTNTSG